MSEHVLDFSTSLYDRDAVEAAAAAYAQLATFELEASESQVVVKISDPHPGVPDLVDHFANHVLHASITGGRRSATTQTAGVM